ncbi:MAG: hypothetical protein WAM39_19075 [Bryobacteraceae bacterium]
MSQDGREPRSSAGSALKKLIFWEFARASWQYDIVVALILVFVFATPRDWFGDLPRASSVVLISSHRGHDQVFLEAALLEGVPESQRAARAAELIRRKTGKQPSVVRIEEIRDQADLKGFIAYTAPRN